LERINHAGQALSGSSSTCDSGEHSGIDIVVLTGSVAALLGADMDTGGVGKPAGGIGEIVPHHFAVLHQPVLVVDYDVSAGCVDDESGDADIVIVIAVAVRKLLAKKKLAR
jgi:hypothetical protein